MKRTVCWPLIIGLLLSCGFVSCAQKDAKPEEIRIGAILPLTGKVGVFGQWIKNGMELALEDIKKHDPALSNRLKIIFEDSQNDAKTGLSSLNKLITVDKVSVVISAMSKVSIPLIPVVNEKKIPLFMQDVTYPEVTKKGDMLFRHFIQSDREADIIAKYAIGDLNIKTVGILYVNDEAGLGAKESFMKAFSGAEQQVVLTEKYEVTDTDMKSQITKVIALQPDAIYLFGNGPSWAITLKQMKELGYKGIILTNTAMYIPNFRNIAGNESIEGVYFTYPYMDITLDSVKKFVELYKQKHGDIPAIESAYAWDIVHIIAKALKSKGNNINEKLANVKNFDGAFGNIQIPPDRDIKTNVGIGMIKNEKIVTIKVEG